MSGIHLKVADKKNRRADNGFVNNQLDMLEPEPTPKIPPSV